MDDALQAAMILPQAKERPDHASTALDEILASGLSWITSLMTRSAVMPRPWRLTRREMAMLLERIRDRSAIRGSLWHILQVSRRQSASAG